MLQKEIAQIPLSHLAAIGFKSSDKPKEYKYSNTLKKSLVDQHINKDINIISAGILEISISVDDYISAVFNDLYFGTIRINEQCKNVDQLIKAPSQAAWVLVTAYYAAYFMASDIAKASGRFIVNFGEEELRELLSQTSSPSVVVPIESHNTFFIVAEHGDMTGDILLRMRKVAAKPHQVVWSNFNDIVNKVKIDDRRLKHLSLLKSILSSSADINAGWEQPSRVRNTWNYSQVNYFGSQGNELAKTFTSIIKSESSTFRWADSNILKPTDANITASIAYIYHLLRLAHMGMMQRLQLV